jgi:uncharacterized protein YggT (Ycf19 family)
MSVPRDDREELELLLDQPLDDVQRTTTTVTERVIDPAAPDAEAVQTTVVSRTTSQAETLRLRVQRARRVIYFIAHVLAIFLFIRFILLLTGANPASGFAAFIYGLTQLFAWPFRDLFGPAPDPQYQLNIVDPSLFVAIAIYYLFAWIIARSIAFAYRPTRAEQVVREVETEIAR